jgi:hypothetical protein
MNANVRSLVPVSDSRDELAADLAQAIRDTMRMANAHPDPRACFGVDPKHHTDGRAGAYWHLQEALHQVLRVLAPRDWRPLHEDCDPADDYADRVYSVILETGEEVAGARQWVEREAARMAAEEAEAAADDDAAAEMREELELSRRLLAAYRAGFSPRLDGPVREIVDAFALQLPEYRPSAAAASSVAYGRAGIRRLLAEVLDDIHAGRRAGVSGERAPVEGVDYVIGVQP